MLLASLRKIVFSTSSITPLFALLADLTPGGRFIPFFMANFKGADDVAIVYVLLRKHGCSQAATSKRNAGLWRRDVMWGVSIPWWTIQEFPLNSFLQDMNSMKLVLPSRFISWRKRRRLQTMLWHHKAWVNSHQRWKQTRFRICFHLWYESTTKMNVTEWQVSWNSLAHMQP